MTTKKPHDREHTKIYSGVRCIGFTEKTEGGFWRATSYAAHMSVGPFKGPGQAEAWVREEIYCRDDKGKVVRTNPHNPTGWKDGE